ncbi:MBL fold metallo-hydrolase [Cryobacterium arcticum]|uniref:MBL fold metallo-hydrolase n=1 Tax=Cryobacterium arcticum TaxID=670052 RepID=A0A1B1BNX1_9MICO|nr:MBL fold metallo-hydrolase [Cryobacterium arcticum]ANP74053.1 MBL fold metallo-hydrolase [Cryobacterium arcticum]
MTESGWVEVGRGVFQRRYKPMDVSVIVVVGPTGLTVVDTRNNPAEAEEIVRDVDARFGRPIVAVVNTHAHYDHTFGNQTFAALPSVPVYGHHRIPQHFAEYEAPRLAAQQADPSREPDKDWADVVLTPPDVLVTTRATLVVGGRTLELIPLDPGHTDTDLAVLVPDCRVWLLGDVIEESGPPMFGSGSYPFTWPTVLAGLLDAIRPGDVIVPGHGAVVDRDFVVRQMEGLQKVADTIRASVTAGTSLQDLPADHDLFGLWPEVMLESAFSRGADQLGG